MTTMPVKTLLQVVVDLLTEAYDGPPDPSATWFVDNQPDSGILGLIAGITAAEASTSVDESGGSGSTIAANVEHLRWSLANANGAFQGQPYNPNWNESWAKIQADAEEWDRLRASLRSEFETMRSILNQQEDLRGEYLFGVLALIPHAAFHLGIIRQMLERVRAQKGRAQK